MSWFNSEQSYKEKIQWLNDRTKEYDEGHPAISDKEWDDIYFEVQDWENKNPTMINPESPTQKIFFSTVSELKKVKHNHLMLSLAKTKDWKDFLDYFDNINPNKDVIGMIKLDGLTCSLRYIDGKLISAETRGNGEVGEDILHNALVIPSIPKRINYEEELIVDGEIICTEQDFEPFSNQYKNPRNFASGSIRLLDAKECYNRNLTFIVWNIITPIENSFINNLYLLEKLGFNVVPHTSSFDYNAKEFLQDKAKELGYPIDGLVGRFDDIEFGKSLGSTDHHTKSAYAYKFYDEEYETEVEDIEWTMGRTGQLTPVLIYKDIEINGAVCNRASLHNISIMTNLMGRAFKGQKVYIYKANQIIPQVKYTQNNNLNNLPLIPIPTECPYCHREVEIKKEIDSEVLYCINPQCEGKLINVLDHFCGKKGLDIKGLSKKTLEKLIEWGWVNDITDIPKLKDHKRDWINKSGFGIASVDKVLKAIDDTFAEAPLSAFISSLGIPLIGSRVAKQICEHIETWKEFKDLINNDFDFTQWAGFGYEMNKSLHKYDYSKADTIVEYITFKLEEPLDKSVKLDGKNFVITGKLQNFKNRDELVNLIETSGGKVQSSISTKTDYLINNIIESTSTKNKRAKELNIPIITEEDLMEMLK